MKKTVLVVGLLLGTMMIFAACTNGDDADANGDAEMDAGANVNIVEVGDMISVEYTGMFEDGEVFDSSATHGQPLTFQAGAGEVIIGFDNAVIGMELGEEKTVTIAPDEGYGEAGIPDQGNPGEYFIPPNSTLIFEIEIVEIIKQ